MDQKNAFLGTEPIGRLLFRLAIPTVIAQLVNMLYNIVDRIYIGHMPQVGSLALTGLGVCTPIILIVSAFAALVASGGASVYSASDLAREELPDLDVTIRGAVSIARRIQDPLAESVKIDPRAIGVGQYQHDVNQKALSAALDQVVTSVVNYVGVDLNTASAALLQHISGLTAATAANIVAYRDENGPFQNRHRVQALCLRLG